MENKEYNDVKHDYTDGSSTPRMCYYWRLPTNKEHDNIMAWKEVYNKAALFDFGFVLFVIYILFFPMVSVLFTALIESGDMDYEVVFFIIMVIGFVLTVLVFLSQIYFNKREDEYIRQGRYRVHDAEFISKESGRRRKGVEVIFPEDGVNKTRFFPASGAVYQAINAKEKLLIVGLCKSTNEQYFDRRFILIGSRKPE